MVWLELEKGLFQLYSVFLMKFQKHLKPKLTKRKGRLAAYLIIHHRKEARKGAERKWNCLVDEWPHKAIWLEANQCCHRDDSFEGADNDLLNDPFTLDGGVSASGKDKTGSLDNSTARPLGINDSASPPMSPLGGFSLGNDTTTGPAENKKERRRSTLISFKRKRNK